MAGKHYSIDSLFRCIEQSKKEEYFCINFSADLAIKIFTFIRLYILIPLLGWREFVQRRSRTRCEQQLRGRVSSPSSAASPPAVPQKRLAEHCEGAVHNTSC